MPAGAIVGRVVRPDRGWVRVALLEPDRLPDAVDPSGVVAARTREDRIGTAVVGDWVVLDDEPDDLEVASVLERDNALRRADPVGEGEQVLAANIDQVLVVAGLDRPRKEGRLQRAIVQVHDAEATPVIVLTKADVVAYMQGGAKPAPRAAAPSADPSPGTAPPSAGPCFSGWPRFMPCGSRPRMTRAAFALLSN